MDDKSKVKKEIDGSLGPPPRKGRLKFAPKVPPKKAAKVVLKTEPVEESKDEAVDMELLTKLKTSQITDPFARKVKTEDKPKSCIQVAFGHGNSSYARSFPMTKSSSADGSASKLPKEYAEPWDYTHTNYPVTLPLRRPYSGDPEILDEEEFGESSAGRAQDAELTAAEELGLMPQSVTEPNKGSKENAKPASTSSKERGEGTRPSSFRGSKLKELPGGFMGKILVYKSGNVKMKIGDTLYDVSAGSNCMFVQEVAAINTRDKHCCTLGEISKRAVVTPDIDYLLGSVDKMEE
ncbi:uncharacterized protein LOC133924110 isoform X2 [Phragmites australis]|uniref:uncharacterized protein LOC133924110 isoform X2 n=1 Tax=Phragmites australis TaxID=29695 RepID=UPI002D7716F8|nr:uncharacterized protein LOC133924110 isoform X2 [Phragmites australis]